MFIQYSHIWVTIIISCLLSSILMFASIIISLQNTHNSKITPYECGFEPFEDARQKFDIQFVLVAILFIIFDLEIVFLLPLTRFFAYIDLTSWFVISIFLLILVFGLIYEWNKGGLEWQ
uniref:NADH-ubiquinone oxidoreductase chain 3 n=1 Tax=Ministeria vibrans TaxID=134558 RepID=M1KFL8_MINVI|nr:NADH dehydrogenase subunit 3 [Ministeria vibrans]AGE93705.1 NADH dehydrogenase subunit 3 [Ministeria vibrans]